MTGEDLMVDRINEAILTELKRARGLHPKWPIDRVHQVAIMAEEAGEALRAALNHQDHGGDIAELKKELIQTGAMVLRVLLNL